MTAPDYVAQVAVLLGQHRIECTGMEGATCWACRDRGWMPMRTFAAHQAEVLAAAGLIPTSVETRIDYACDDDCPGWWTVRRPEGLRRVPCEHATRRTRAVTDWKDATDD